MNAKERIDHKESRRLYRKVGRTYVPCNDLDVFEGLQKGWWLVKIEDGCTSIRACVRPDKAEIIAAAREKEEKIIDIIRQASQARPRSGIPISAEALKDWQDFISKHGDEFNMLEYPSLCENAEKIMQAILEHEL
jgi:hypothetical protein